MSRKKPAAPWLLRIARAHWRLWLSVTLGIVAYTLLPDSWGVVTRLLVAWDSAVVLYLAAAVGMMVRSTAGEIKQHAAAQDEGAFGLLVLVVAAAIASFGAIFAELSAVESSAANYNLYLALTITTVVLSWTFTHAIFALHYAYEFYGDGARARGLNFPDEPHPDYWDFVYFALVIGMTFQVSDVSVSSRGARRTVTVHGAISFFFNTAIVALAVNIASNAIGSR